MDVQESPSIELLSIRVQDVCSTLMKRDGSTSKTNDAIGSVEKEDSHGKEHDDSVDDRANRIAYGEFPETEKRHLCVSNEDKSEHDALKDGSP